MGKPPTASGGEAPTQKEERQRGRGQEVQHMLEAVSEVRASQF